jgi:hypothetical protein
MLLCNSRDVCSKVLPEGGNAGEVEDAVVDVDAQDKAAGNEACLDSHGWGVAFFKVDLALAVGWDATVVGKVVWQEGGAFEGARGHAGALELCVGVGEVIVEDLL